LVLGLKRYDKLTKRRKEGISDGKVASKREKEQKKSKEKGGNELIL